ncbi:MAG: RpiB/LacA/LacB family sugar-phosphate isomerase [Planctomycetota bacterium]
MIIAIGADHRGLPQLTPVAALVRDGGHEVQEVTPRDAARIDYPTEAYRVARLVAENKADRGILLSGSGLGMAIVANRIPGVRAIVGHDEWSASISRSHHDSNVITIATDMVGPPMILRIVDRWLNTGFEAGRHARRLAMIRWIESGGDPADMPDTDADTEADTDSGSEIAINATPPADGVNRSDTQ